MKRRKKKQHLKAFNRDIYLILMIFMKKDFYEARISNQFSSTKKSEFFNIFFEFR